MTLEELMAIEARATAATKGPWVIAEDDDGYATKMGNTRGIGSGTNYDDICRTDSGAYPPCIADAEFIVHAREDVPALLAEVRRLQALIDQWEYEHQIE